MEIKTNRKVAVITSYFNPLNYTNSFNNYIKFAHNIKKYADLFTVELSFGKSFQVKEDNTIQIRGCKNNILWQKEALLNIAIENLPKKYTDIAWIDCDIIFQDSNWLADLYTALNDYHVVQLFENANKLDISNNIFVKKSIVSCFPNQGEYGFGWAAKRDILEEIKLLDNQIFGGADFVMASAFMNKPSIIENKKGFINDEYTRKWLTKATEIIKGKTTYLKSTITHLYHGNAKNRLKSRVEERNKLINTIDINKDVKKVDGLWHISDKHLNSINQFFRVRQEDDNILIEKFFNTDFKTHEECIDFYISNICENVMYTSPSIIAKVRDKMVNGIKNYAKLNSCIYKNISNDNILTRNELLNKKDWICTNINCDRILHQHTSGSTTGKPFHYYSDKKYFDFIQKESEFDLILKEFNLYNKPLRILNLFKHPFNPKPDNFFLKTENYSKSRFHTYGAKETTTFFVNWDGYMDNPDDWHGKFLEFLSKRYFDIVLASGPVVNIFTRYIKNNNFKHTFATLLSHTTEFPRISDLQFLKSNTNIRHWCDHMRCYDGGANFFTCKHGTYHLNDHLSWTYQGPDNKMISTDYFNIVAPFVNYWNGDLCEIKDEYQLCECGRWYRPFKMLQNRPFALKGPTKLTEIKEKISRLDFKSSIDQVQFENLTANVYLKNRLDESYTNILKEILQDYEVKIYE